MSWTVFCVYRFVATRRPPGSLACFFGAFFAFGAAAALGARASLAATTLDGVASTDGFFLNSPGNLGL